MKRAERIAPQLHAIEAWLDEVFCDVVAGERGSRLFWGSAMARTFAQPLWQLGLGTFTAPAAAPLRGFHSALAKSLSLVIWERQRDARLRFSEGTGAPSRWLALLPGWPASNHTLRELAHGDYGILLYGGFDAPGGKRAASLAALDAFSPTRTLQCIRPERDFAQALSAGALACRRVWQRMSKPPLGVTQGLAKLASIDVLRCVLASRRCGELEGRFERVFFPHASLVTHATLDAGLQRRGARTYELVHGALAETETMVVEGRSFSSVKVLRTRVETKLLAQDGQELLGGYMPRLHLAVRAPATPPRRVLILSNYATQPLHLRGALPRLHEQAALLRCVAALEDRGLSLHWRPHPYDDRDAVNASLRAHPGIVLTTGSLDEEISAADLVISSISSVLVDVALAERPLLVHAPAIHDPEDIAALLPDRFTSAAELIALFDRLPAPSLKQILFGDEPPRQLLDIEAPSRQSVDNAG